MSGKNDVEKQKADVVDQEAADEACNSLIVFVTWVAALLVVAGLMVALITSTNRSGDESLSPEDNAASEGTEVEFFADSLTAVSRRSLQTKYPGCDELTHDIELAARYIYQTRVENEIVWNFNADGTFKYANDGFPIAQVSPLEEADSSVESAAGGSGKVSENVATTEDSFGTNNQVEGVDEADIVKSDGVYVYAAYGREIVRLDVANRTVVDRTAIPSGCDYDGNIASLLLTETQLVVITNGYCREEEENDEEIIVETDEEIIVETDEEIIVDTETTSVGDISFSPYSQGIVTANDATRVHVYNKETMEMVVSDKPVRGNYVTARSIGDNVHLVTNAYMNTWILTDGLSAWRSELYGGSNITADGYRSIAEGMADAKVTEYAAKLRDELTCEELQKISFMSNVDDAETLQTSEEDYSVKQVQGFSLDSLSIVTSFSAASSDVTSDGDVDFSTSVMMQPSSYWQVYASEDYLVLATRGQWEQRDGTGSPISANPATYLITYELDGASATASQIGVVDGYVLNSFSIDHDTVDGTDYLRVATTSEQIWGVTDGDWELTSNSTSQVTVLEFTDDGADSMTQVGKLEGLGKPGEQIFSVRFVGGRGFIVTFERTDPFYTIDLSDPANPTAVGELEIPGFSNYLHPIGDDLIIGVGQDVDEDTGRELGLQVSLFDVSDFASPVRIQNYVHAVDDDESSSSEVQYDHKAFRYLSESGLLILPVTVFGNWDFFFDRRRLEEQEGFDGFMVLKVDEEDGIEPYDEIEHGSDFYDGCWSSDFLQSRSLVFGGIMWTLKGHSINYRDLSNRTDTSPSTDLDEDVEEDCSSTYFY